jgi:hypothetical protein
MNNTASPSNLNARAAVNGEPCDLCLRHDASYADSVDPHTHCDHCDGALLPGMTECVWCETQSPAGVDLEDAMCERWSLGVVPFGPLTRDEVAAVEAYERHCEDQEREEREAAHSGGLRICPACERRAVRITYQPTRAYGGGTNTHYACVRAECGFEDVAV